LTFDECIKVKLFKGVFMEVSVQISIYPLGREHLHEEIRRFVEILGKRGLHFEIGSMSTIVTGDTAVIFPALQEAFESVSSQGGCVMVSTISNACHV
jgi:uncharacterized protein YqgV (UPF0045/DUF77 family)